MVLGPLHYRGPICNVPQTEQRIEEDCPQRKLRRGKHQHSFSLEFSSDVDSGYLSVAYTLLELLRPQQIEFGFALQLKSPFSLMLPDVFLLIAELPTFSYQLLYGHSGREDYIYGLETIRSERPSHEYLPSTKRLADGNIGSTVTLRCYAGSTSEVLASPVEVFVYERLPHRTLAHYIVPLSHEYTSVNRRVDFGISKEAQRMSRSVAEEFPESERGNVESLKQQRPTLHPDDPNTRLNSMNETEDIRAVRGPIPLRASSR
ncbi:hypothetical protein C8F04DRAFT_1233617 [Mycena alexandri]|uniref:Uncharacterized protein n=1 Tax=Mycena alexandri TaxID=1745969 RepID=A0AAD6SX70_9AGAR|nr:hypothetical protein C8F04DRAFT_1233617 [Mycena alexandri]